MDGWMLAAPDPHQKNCSKHRAEEGDWITKRKVFSICPHVNILKLLPTAPASQKQTSLFLSSFYSSVKGTEGSRQDSFCLWKPWLPGLVGLDLQQRLWSLCEDHSSLHFPSCLPQTTPKSLLQKSWEEQFESLTKWEECPKHQTWEIILGMTVTTVISGLCCCKNLLFLRRLVMSQANLLVSQEES